jgi:hypothetical protein
VKGRYPVVFWKSYIQLPEEAMKEIFQKWFNLKDHNIFEEAQKTIATVVPQISLAT